MDLFPLDLILAVAVASATIFLGFLPTRNIHSDFFARETFRAAIAWVFVGVVAPPAISHYHIIIAIVCFAGWRQMRRDKALNGKMWLSIASGLGISIGVMLILATTPRAYPPGLPQQNQTLLLASIYLGGTVIGLAYVCWILVKNVSTNSGVTSDLVQRYAGLLVPLVIARAAVLLGFLFTAPEMAGRPKSHEFPLPETTHTLDLFGYDFSAHGVHAIEGSTSLQLVLLLVLAVILLPALSFIARQTSRNRSQVQAGYAMAAIFILGFLAEILARLLVL